MIQSHMQMAIPSTCGGERGEVGQEGVEQWVWDRPYGTDEQIILNCIKYYLTIMNTKRQWWTVVILHTTGVVGQSLWDKGWDRVCGTEMWDKGCGTRCVGLKVWDRRCGTGVCATRGVGRGYGTRGVGQGVKGQEVWDKECWTRNVEQGV